MKIRNVEKDDLDEIMDAERASNLIFDPDFEVEAVAPWTMSREEVLKVVRSRRDGKSGTFDTRVFVVEIPIEYRDNRGKTKKRDWVCGAFGYECHPDSYFVRFITVHPDSDRMSVLKGIAAWLKDRADRSVTRKRVVIHLVDRPEANLQELFQFWRSQKFKFSLVSDYFPGEIDAWRGSWTSAVYPNPAETAGLSSDDGPYQGVG